MNIYIEGLMYKRRSYLNTRRGCLRNYIHRQSESLRRRFLDYDRKTTGALRLPERKTHNISQYNGVSSVDTNTTGLRFENVSSFSSNQLLYNRHENDTRDDIDSIGSEDSVDSVTYDFMNGIDIEDVQKMEKEFDEDPQNIVSRNVVVSVGSLFASTDSEESKNISHKFMNTLKNKNVKATDQGMSGRCWIFAGLNVFRHSVINALKIDNFEFSQTYLFFWDKLERANLFIQQFIDGVRGAGGDIVDLIPRERYFIECIENVKSDGGWWCMFSNLVSKYGLVPKSAMPETFQSEDSEDMNEQLATILDTCISRIYKLKHKKIPSTRGHKQSGYISEELRPQSVIRRQYTTMMNIKQETIQQVYNTLVKFLGKPPKTFKWIFTNENGETNIINQLTPISFCDVVMPVFNIDDFVVLSNYQSVSMPYYKKYTICNTSNMLSSNRNNVNGVDNGVDSDDNNDHNRERLNHTFINLPIQELRKYAKQSVISKIPVWFAGDITKGFHPYLASLDDKIINRDSLFGKQTRKMDKETRLMFRNQSPNHAMTLTGINLDSNGKKIIGWQVENSWGYWNNEEAGLDGFMYMSDQWFEEYVSEIVIHKSMLSRNILNRLNSETTYLDPWNAY